MPRIELKQADKTDHQPIVNLMQFYNYDFSEWIPLSFTDDGFFAIRPKLDDRRIPGIPVDLAISFSPH
ncbi:hypothetical protein GGD68_007049 [Paraburkholderia fungorum]|jgi:hypothetical protein|uniref:hypothetical protein n=1 Tax=Paraburkholderia fungorum TaxID=134537 RepID=UPI001612B4A5|nr:hypothetical protein [Paraburkholderia fungorum]MBB4518243.1 hypothetical protein [Paraburkholderia fungorum]